MDRPQKAQHHAHNVVRLKAALHKVNSTIPYVLNGMVRPALVYKRKRLEELLRLNTLELVVLMYEMENELRELNQQVSDLDGYDYGYMLIKIGEVERQLEEVRKHIEP